MQTIYVTYSDLNYLSHNRLKQINPRKKGTTNHFQTLFISGHRKLFALGYPKMGHKSAN